MGAGYHGGFGHSKGKEKHNCLSGDKKDIDKKFFIFNQAGSKSVKLVQNVTISDDAHSVPQSAEPNSVHISRIDGKIHSERYFDNQGKPYLDIDYSNHGNPKIHPVVPHEHIIIIKNGVFYRDKKWRDIQK